MFPLASCVVSKEDPLGYVEYEEYLNSPLHDTITDQRKLFLILASQTTRHEISLYHRDITFQRRVSALESFTYRLCKMNFSLRKTVASTCGCTCAQDASNHFPRLLVNPNLTVFEQQLKNH